jgi:hypothetical protein
MAFPTDTFTGKSGDLDSFIPNIWGSRINDFAKEVLKITPHTTDRSDELAGGGNTLYTPNMTEMSANQKVNASAVTLNFRGLLEKTLCMLNVTLVTN